MVRLISLEFPWRGALPTSKTLSCFGDETKKVGFCDMRLFETRMFSL